MPNPRNHAIFQLQRKIIFIIKLPILNLILTMQATQMFRSWDLILMERMRKSTYLSFFICHPVDVAGPNLGIVPLRVMNLEQYNNKKR